MKIKYSILAVSMLAMVSSQAAITLFAEYKLGEAGSLGTNNSTLLDSSGNNKTIHNNVNGNTATVGTTGVFAPGSAAYINTSDSSVQGWYSNTSLTGLATDNFAIGIYVRASSNDAATRGDVFSTNGSGTTGSFRIGLFNNGWGAADHNRAWLGTADGSDFTANTWAHLAVIRLNGVTNFYLNGTDVGGQSSNAPSIGEAHFSVDSGGGTAFDGHLDDLRIVTFTSGETPTTVLAALTVPEPSAALLGSLGILALLRRRRN